MKQELTTETIKFDDMSTPFGCCGSDRISVVTVQYVDENNTNISPLVTLSGRVGNKYTTEQKTISGYTFASVDGAKEGEFQPSPVSVVYHYTKNAE
ncbi:MAG: MucBP domain-containing protein [Paraclostridium sp.]